MAINDLYGFKEQRYSSLRHNIRIFIFGAEVSQWIQGAVSVTYGNRDSYNTASFDLSNANKLWQLTRNNLAGKFIGPGHELYSEQPKREIFEWKNNKFFNPEISLDVTQSQFSANSTSEASVDEKGKVVFEAPQEGNERKYRLAVNDCIFNKNDPVRIFVQNPYSSRDDEWVEVFCGFVQDHPITTDYANGRSSVRISCYCVRQLMTKLRVKINAFRNQQDPTPVLNAGFFSDYAKSGILTHTFANYSLEEAIKELILGDPGQVASAPKDAMGNPEKGTAGGVGNFRLGNVVCYDPDSPGNTLERWHLMTMFGVNKVNFPAEEGPSRGDFWLKNREVYNIGRSTRWIPRRDQDAGGPDARYLHFLLPAGGTGPGTLVQSQNDNNVKAEIEWSSRWEIIRDFAAKLDFQVLTSPSGDILVEFPMYGFSPKAFSPTGPPTTQDINPLEVPEGLAAFMTFDIHQKEDTLNDEAEDFPTILQVSGGIAQGKINESAAAGNFRSYVYSPVLAARYGAITENADFPFAGQSANDISGKSGGADSSTILKRLTKLGLIEFSKRMADASTWQGSVCFRPFLFPNRPVYFKRSARIGNLTSVSYNWNVGKDAGTNLSLNMLMAERYDPKKGTSSFRLLTGASNTPISYNSIWGPDDASDLKSGVVSGPTNDEGEGDSAIAEDPNPPANSAEKRKDVGGPPPIADMGMLYPRFRELVQKILDEAAKEQDLPQVKVMETFRDGVRQNALKGAGASNASDFMSYHQYGLAVDIGVIVDGKVSNDHAHYDKLQVINLRVNRSSERNLTLVWGGNFKKNGKDFYDGGHFQIPDTWMSIASAKQLKDLNPNDPKYYERIWAQIDAKVFGATSSSSPNALPSDTRPAAFFPTFSGAAIPKRALDGPQLSLTCNKVDLKNADYKELPK